MLSVYKKWRVMRIIRRFMWWRKHDLDWHWGRVDCLTEVFGNQERPDCIKTRTPERALAKFLKEFDNVSDGFDWGFKKYGNHDRLKDVNVDPMIGDVVIGSTYKYKFAIAKVGENYLPVCRTRKGYEVVEFVEVVGIWRPRK